MTLAATVPERAPARSIPSIAMLITPERSQRTPESAPNVMGTARSSVLLSIPRRFISSPRAAQARKENTNRKITTPSTRFVRAPNPRVSWTPPRKAQTAARR